MSEVLDISTAPSGLTGPQVLGMTVEMRLQDHILLRYGDGDCALFLKPNRERPDPTVIHHPLDESQAAAIVANGYAITGGPVSGLIVVA